MTSDADDALSWEGDEDKPAPSRGRKQREKRPSDSTTNGRALPDGWNAVGRDSETVGRIESDGTVSEPTVSEPTVSESGEHPQGLSTPMLVLVGIVGGVYLLYTVGWIIGGLNLQGSALFLVPAVMYQVAVWAAVLAPTLWFAAVWLLTRHSASWVRVVGFLAGAALLVPWPFVMTGAAGS